MVDHPISLLKEWCFVPFGTFMFKQPMKIHSHHLGASVLTPVGEKIVCRRVIHIPMQALSRQAAGTSDARRSGRLAVHPFATCRQTLPPLQSRLTVLLRILLVVAVVVSFHLAIALLPHASPSSSSCQRNKKNYRLHRSIRKRKSNKENRKMSTWQTLLR